MLTMQLILIRHMATMHLLAKNSLHLIMRSPVRMQLCTHDAIMTDLNKWLCGWDNGH